MASLAIISRNVRIIWVVPFSVLILWSAFVLVVPTSLLLQTAVTLFNEAAVINAIATQPGLITSVFAVISLVLVILAFVLPRRVFPAPIASGDEVSIQSLQRWMIGQILSWVFTIPSSVFGFLIAGAGQKSVAALFLAVSICSLFLLRPNIRHLNDHG